MEVPDAYLLRITRPLSVMHAALPGESSPAFERDSDLKRTYMALAGQKIHDISEANLAKLASGSTSNAPVADWHRPHDD